MALRRRHYVEYRPRTLHHHRHHHRGLCGEHVRHYHTITGVYHRLNSWSVYEVTNITVYDDLNCNAGTFTTLAATTGNITNLTTNVNYTTTLHATSTLAIPSSTGTAILGYFYFSPIDNKLQVYGPSGRSLLPHFHKVLPHQNLYTMRKRLVL